MTGINQVVQCQGPLHLVEHDWIFETPPMIEEVYDAREAWERGDHSRTETILTAVLKEHPDHLDALMVLGCLRIEQGHDAIGTALLAEAVHQGERAMPDRLDARRGRLEWGFVTNRSYLRACSNLADVRLKQGARDEARRLWRRLARLSPRDELGAREELKRHRA